METINKVAATVTFPTPSTLYLTDDFPCPIEDNSIIYPSVRHAVIARKTPDPEIRKKIAEISLPADLKNFEQSLKARWWNNTFVITWLSIFTEKKFKTHPELREKILATYGNEIRFVPIPGQARYDILHEEEQGYYGEILMKTRAKLLNF